jgi:hypothetical protein
MALCCREGLARSIKRPQSQVENFLLDEMYCKSAVCTITLFQDLLQSVCFCLRIYSAFKRSILEAHGRESSVVPNSHTPLFQIVQFRYYYSLDHVFCKLLESYFVTCCACKRRIPFFFFRHGSNGVRQAPARGRLRRLYTEAYCRPAEAPTGA